MRLQEILSKLRLTKIVVFSFVILTSLSASRCRHYPPPKTELCVSGSTSYQCNDLRRSKAKQDYDRSRKQILNYICTNPRDFGIIRNYCSDLRRDLIKCKKGLDSR